MKLSRVFLSVSLSTVALSLSYATTAQQMPGGIKQAVGQNVVLNQNQPVAPQHVVHHHVVHHHMVHHHIAHHHRKHHHKSHHHKFHENLPAWHAKKKPRVTWHGFLSAGGAGSDETNNYYMPNRAAINHDLNFNSMAALGVRVNARLNQQFKLVAQMVASGDSTNGKTAYSPKLDWAYLAYTPLHDLTVRAGRFRLPALMYSTTQSVGYTYPWVFLPAEVYAVAPFSHVNGVDAMYQHAIGNTTWNFQAQPFYGTNDNKVDVNVGLASAATLNYQNQNVVGTAASISGPYVTLRGSFAYSTLSTNGAASGTMPTSFAVNHKADNFFSGGVKAHYMHFIFNGEFAHRQSPANMASLTGWYAMLGYNWHGLLPSFTFAHLKTTNDNKLTGQGLSALAEDQESYTGGLDYYINRYVVAKASVSWIKLFPFARGSF